MAEKHFFRMNGDFHFDWQIAQGPLHGVGSEQESIPPDFKSGTQIASEQKQHEE